jgi:two-component system chemotaxis response regulator CheY
LAETGRRALVVDDTAIMRLIVSRILRESQFDIVEASNGAEAIQAFFREKPDIVLMDLNMEGIDGTAAIRGILQIDKNARIVVNVLRLGAKRYVTKPFTPEKLLDAVYAALA